MALLNVFFLATDDELAAVDIGMGPAHPAVDAKGVMDVELATLECILHDGRSTTWTPSWA